MAHIRGTWRPDTVTTAGVSTAVRGGPATGDADRISTRWSDDQVHAGGGGDLVRGGGGNDKLWGDGGNDGLLGGSGDDCLWGRTGNDRLLGGYGMDEAVYAGERSSYEVITLADGSVTVRDLNESGDGINKGFDTLVGVERIRFTGTEPFLIRAGTTNEGEPANGTTSLPAISADGSRVAFSSDALNLDAGWGALTHFWCNSSVCWLPL